MSPLKITDQHGLYFVTCTIVGWIDVFSRKCRRDTVIESLKYCRREKGLLIGAYVIMTNHIHLVVKVKDNSAFTLSDILRDFKKFTANTILKAINSPKESRQEWMNHMFTYFAKYNTNNREKQFWIQDNYPVELFTQRATWQKINYIHNNPVAAGWVDHPAEYVYSSARNYERGNDKGLMEIDLMEPWWVGK